MKNESSVTNKAIPDESPLLTSFSIIRNTRLLFAKNKNFAALDTFRLLFIINVHLGHAYTYTSSLGLIGLKRIFSEVLFKVYEDNRYVFVRNPIIIDALMTLRSVLQVLNSGAINFNLVFQWFSSFVWRSSKIRQIQGSFQLYRLHISALDPILRSYVRRNPILLYIPVDRWRPPLGQRGRLGDPCLWRAVQSFENGVFRSQLQKWSQRAEDYRQLEGNLCRDRLCRDVP